MLYKIDGIKLKLTPTDVDMDGEVGGIEKVKSHADSSIMHIKESTELGEALQFQNKDVENADRFSDVDFISRIDPFQLAPLVVVETLATMGVISRDSRKIVRHVMRKSVSLKGKGRQEYVDVVVGKMARDASRGGVQQLAAGDVKK